MAKKRRITHTHLYVVIGFLVVTVLGLTAMVWQARGGAQAAGMIAQKQLVPSQCDTSGELVINVTQKVVNSIDSGQAGNWWAFDDYNRKIHVWKQVSGNYCAVVDYEGKFDAQAGQVSPGNTGTLTGSEDGDFKGGYRAIITGTLKSPADLPTRGSIGTVDYNCDLSGNCPGSFSWTDKYFATGATGYTFTYDWWGWQYHTRGQKVWINSSDGNSGDIL